MREDNLHIKYTGIDIEKYWKGQLSATEMHALENAALDDPFLADAMEGFRIRNQETGLQADMEDLANSLNKRIAKKIPKVSYGWWKVAAAVFVLMGSVWLYTTLNKSVGTQTLTKNKGQKQAATAPMADTVKALAAPAKMDSFLDVARETNKKETTLKRPAQSPDEKQKASSSLAKAAAVPRKEPFKNAAEMESAKNEVAAKEIEEKKALASSSAAGSPARLKGEVADSNNELAGRQPLEYSFNGTVVNQSNEPLSGATVIIPGRSISTTTDKSGFFSFKNADTVLNISIASVGYDTQNLTLHNNRLSNQITLHPAQNALSEVVVTGLNKQNVRKTRNFSVKILDAEPTVGWKEYSDYIEKNKKLPGQLKTLHGDVVVSFVVDGKGALRNFKIEKSLDEQLDQEAIRLIKQGPSWRILKSKKAKVSILVPF